MQRICIFGSSETGKSSLARKMIAPSPVPVIVHDPYLYDWPNAKIVTASPDDFIAALVDQKGQPCIAVIDEADLMLSMSHKENFWIFTRGRHTQITPILCSQRPQYVAPTPRNQGTDLYLFNIGFKDAKELAESYNAPALADAHNLPQGHFFHRRWQDGKILVTKHKLW